MYEFLLDLICALFLAAALYASISISLRIDDIIGRIGDTEDDE